jgi:outer membrane lipoprotein-sorting protein
MKNCLTAKWIWMWISMLLVALAAATSAPAASTSPAAADATADEILKQADSFRGTWPSLAVRVRIDNYEADALSESADFDVAVKGENSLVFFLAPRDKGRSLLMRGDDMWIYLPSVARGVRITPIQRLLGNTSNGDLARLRYAIDYTPALAGEETVKEIPCVLLDLQAKRKAATYQRIRYAVRKGDSMPIKADFFLASGRQIKTAWFEEPKAFAGHLTISRIVIYDAINTKSKTVMLFQNFEPRAINDKIFNPSRTEGN